MPSLKFPLVALVTTFIVGLTTPSAVAFTITPQPNVFNKLLRSGGASIRYKPIDVYDTGIIKGMTYLDPSYVENLELGGTREFIQKLEQEFGQEKGWSYEKGQNLNGSFNIEYYYACGYTTSCGNDLTSPVTGRKIDPFLGIVGAGFQLGYYPLEGDPTPGGETLHWIQWVNSVSPDVGYVDIIDNGGYPDSPFYDIRSTEETAFPIQLAFNDRIGSFQMRPLSAPEPQSVPESTSAIALLALSAWSIVKALKIRFDK